jgi:ABC-type uncharacterized transport system ATPase subunit
MNDLRFVVAIIHRLWEIAQLQRSVTVMNYGGCMTCCKMADASRVSVESGLLYTAMSIPTFITTLLDNNLLQIFSVVVRLPPPPFSLQSFFL